MAPKKKKGKGPSKAEEDRIELVRLRYHVDEAEKRLTEQVKTGQHLREVHIQKTTEYDSLVKDADRLAGDYQRNVECLEEELMSKEEALTHKCQMLETELKRVINELDCCRTFEEENKQLKQTMRELREEIDSKEVIHADEVFKQKKEAYRQQSMMEQELQRMVREMEDKYRAQAFAALAEESRNAIVAKGQLELKFLRQDETVQAMNERFEQLENANSELKINLDLTENRNNQQAVKTQKMHRDLQETHERCFALERDLRLMTLECQSAQAKGDQVEAMAREVEEMKKKLRGSEKRAAKWKSRAMDIAKLASISPHGMHQGQVHGNFAVKGTTQKLGFGEESDDEIPQDDEADDDGNDEEEEEDLQAIWHAAFAPTAKSKQRGVSSAPGRSRGPPGGVLKSPSGSKGNRSSTSMGLRQGSGSRGPKDVRSNQFANFSCEGRNVRVDSASSRRTGSSDGFSLPSVPRHVHAGL